MRWSHVQSHTANVICTESGGDEGCGVQCCAQALVGSSKLSFIVCMDACIAM